MNKMNFTAATQSRGGSASRYQIAFSALVFSLCLAVFAVSASAQPAPGPAKSANIPAVQEKKLKNGLTVAVIEKPGVPIVTAQLFVRAGASSEPFAKAGDVLAMTKSIKKRRQTASSAYALR